MRKYYISKPNRKLFVARGQGIGHLLLTNALVAEDLQLKNHQSNLRLSPSTIISPKSKSIIIKIF